MATILRPHKLDGGLVTSRPPIDLAPNELTRAKGCFYKPNSTAVFPIPIRSALGNAAADPVGIAYIEFDNASDRILVHAGDKIYQSAAGVSLSFTTLSVPIGADAILSGNNFEVITYGQKALLLNGKNVPFIMDAGTSLYTAGHDPVTATITAVASGAGSGWNTDTGAGSFWYWVTEYNQDFDVESAYTGTATGVTVVGTNDKVTITKPTFVNSEASFWRIYRAPAAGIADYDDPFPDGFRIATLGNLTTTYDDTGDPAFEDPYATVVIGGQVTTAAPSRNGAPPVADTGDIFENSAVVNDVSDSRTLHYTFGGSISSWPALYRITFPDDNINVIRTIGDVLLVGMKEAIWRAHSLPRATDAEFDYGRSFKQLTGNHGMVSKRGTCRFTTEDGIERVAFISRQGLFITDGYRIKRMESDLDWDAVINIDYLDQAVLINFPRHQILMMIYTPENETKNTQVLYFHYHVSHIKQDGGMKVTGPHDMEAIEATYMHTDSTLPTMIAIDSVGDIKAEGHSGAASAMELTTAPVYGKDLTDRLIMRRMYAYAKENGPAGTLGITEQRVDDSPLALPTVEFTPKASVYVRKEVARNVAGYQLNVTSKVPMFEIGVELDAEQGEKD